MTGKKRDTTKLKLVWPVNTAAHRSKIILSPVVIKKHLSLDKESFVYEGYAYISWCLPPDLIQLCLPRTRS